MFSRLTSLVRRRAWIVSGALAAAAVLTGAGVAHAGLSLVYPPPPYGYPALQSYSQLAANWWKWALTQPAATSPLLDTTGANCGAGQSGAVWFLAGGLDSTPVHRTCTVPYGKTIVFPIVNSAYFAFTTDPADQRTETFVRDQAAAGIAGATNLRAEIDGVPVLSPLAYHEKSVLFKVTLPDGNIFGLPAGMVLDPSADEGYYLALIPLLPGKHTVHFHGELPASGLVEDVSYDLVVK